MTFDVDTFVGDCQATIGEGDAHHAIKGVLERALADRSALAEALPPDRAGITRLFVSDDLTILKVVWGPGMRLYPHDHRMWATIGIYTGGEDNAFFRRDGSTLVESGGRALRPGDICMLGSEAVHSVANPTTEFAGAIHIYGGDFFATPRSEWHGTPYTEEPYDVGHTLALFDAANASPAG
jgi:predicted metal-dependent enzyme (double-stranded beta helix superfamily)